MSTYSSSRRAHADHLGLLLFSLEYTKAVWIDGYVAVFPKIEQRSDFLSVNEPVLCGYFFPVVKHDNLSDKQKMVSMFCHCILFAFIGCITIRQYWSINLFCGNSFYTKFIAFIDVPSRGAACLCHQCGIGVL